MGKIKQILKDNKLIFGFIIVMLGAVGAVVGVYVYLAASDGVVCEEDIIKEANPYILENNVAELKKVNTEIQDMRNFETDINCLYIVTNYYLNAGDADNAKRYLTKLEKIYNPSAGYSKAFGSNVTQPYEMKRSVRFLEKPNKQQPQGIFIIEEEQ